MKRRALLICFAVCLFSLLIAPVFAHPGRTDGKGGHTNHSTGEYHYHHGYSAHDHYDMDGDGDLDCPYDFDDKTNRNNSDAISYPPTTEPSSMPTEATVSESNSTPNTDFISVLLWIVAIGVYVIIMVIFPILMSR